MRAAQPPGQLGGDGSTDLLVPLMALGAGGDRLAWMWPGGVSGWRDAAADSAWGQAPWQLRGACLRPGAPLAPHGPRAAVAPSRAGALPAVSAGTLLLAGHGEGAAEGADDGSVRLSQQLVLRVS